MTDRYRKMIIFGALMVFCISFIFSNSLKNSEESHKDSNVIVEVVEDVADRIIPNNHWDWNYIVRKSAHIFEFFVLGVCTMLFFSQVHTKTKLNVLSAFVCVIVIASTDEFIQRFTGRTSSLKDVMIDLFGASLGICFILLTLILWKQIRLQSKKSNHTALESV